MNKHLDLTIDFETCALSANAAPMQVAVVPWLRDNDTDPFCNEEELEPYSYRVDLRTCVVEGFDFDPDTLKWWTNQSEAAKKSVTANMPFPVQDLAYDLLSRYVKVIVEKYQLESVCLWCQGMDVDIAILRNLCCKYHYDLKSVIPHTSFRDCRTVILEAALIEAERSMNGTGTKANGVALPFQILQNPSLAYKLYAPLPEKYANDSEAHDALYDAMRSSWYTWQALKWLRQLIPYPFMS